MEYIFLVWDFLKNNENLITGLITGLSTVLLVVVTYLLYQVSKKEPLMSVYIKHNKASFHFLDLVIENIGEAPAYDVKVNVIRDIDHPKDYVKLATKNLLIKPKYFAPRQKAETLLISLLDYNTKEMENKSKEIELEIVYYKRKGYFGCKRLRGNKSETFVIDFDALAGKHQLGSDGDSLIRINKNLEMIQKDFHKLLGSGSINVITQTKKQKKDENKEILKMIKRQR